MPAASTLGRLVRLAPLGLRLTLARPALRTATVFSLNAIRTKATAATEAAPKTKKAVATPAATTATTKAKATEAAPKKATPKKAVAVKATVKKAAPKKKVVKKAAPKKVVKKVKKPVLTPEQKALRREKASAKRAKEAVKRADNKAKLEIKAKKVASLDAPTGAQGRVNPWTQFFTEQTKGTSGFKPLSSEMLAAYKNLSADEKAVCSPLLAQMPIEARLFTRLIGSPRALRPARPEEP